MGYRTFAETIASCGRPVPESGEVSTGEESVGALSKSSRDHFDAERITCCRYFPIGGRHTFCKHVPACTRTHSHNTLTSSLTASSYADSLPHSKALNAVCADPWSNRALCKHMHTRTVWRSKKLTMRAPGRDK